MNKKWTENELLKKLDIDRKNKSARVGKVLVGDKNTRGKAIGQQMIKEILKVAFDELQLHRVSLGVFDFNVSAIACNFPQRDMANSITSFIDF